MNNKPKNNLGIAITKFELSDMVYCLQTRIIKHRNLFNSISVFIEQSSPPLIQPNFAVMQSSEMVGYDGVLVATDINSASLLAKTPGGTRKFFYVWDLEWLNQPNLVLYGPYMAVYTSPKLEIIVRSEEHKDILENNFNCKVKLVMPNFDINLLAEYLEKNNGKEFTDNTRISAKRIFS